jgi:hypothetical protein
MRCTTNKFGRHIIMQYTQVRAGGQGAGALLCCRGGQCWALMQVLGPLAGAKSQARQSASWGEWVVVQMRPRTPSERASPGRNPSGAWACQAAHRAWPAPQRSLNAHSCVGACRYALQGSSASLQCAFSHRRRGMRVAYRVRAALGPCLPKTQHLVFDAARTWLPTGGAAAAFTATPAPAAGAAAAAARAAQRGQHADQRWAGRAGSWGRAPRSEPRSSVRCCLLPAQPRPQRRPTGTAQYLAFPLTQSHIH